MKAFKQFCAVVAPLDRINVDTDAILPKQFMKSISKFGYGDYLFDNWRYLDEGQPGDDCSIRPINLQFVLNQPRFRSAEILLCRDNFGCGSSREHAPWALRDFGIKALISTSFADIFYGNCLKNGVLPIVLTKDEVDHLFTLATSDVPLRLVVDLAAQTIVQPSGVVHHFEIDAFRKNCLILGLDEISLSLTHADAVRLYESMRRTTEPWLFQDG
ncbi:3-isopropylmalate dehydratase small subunit [Pseudomonas sp. TH10]|uniref:3-isopropylmalate dehydratase small subunit n=1 Tax=Pseudomonas sp. TH10 TaxID=2796376 RepID=UPI0019134C57|nr:3-isopropylmalate dehydratase small subunit [Pseudomonas sp. TH10]MBK5516262.1 3-isopropylmalate dehydratase small subunit [Pseudomonas sp. TH10]